MSLRAIGWLATGVVAAAVCGACAGSADPAASDAMPAARPSGASAQSVRYYCQAGRRDTIVMSLPDPRQLAQVLNPVNVCEYDGGLADVTVRLRCAEGTPEREFVIAAVGGKLPASTGKKICG